MCDRLNYVVDLFSGVGGLSLGAARAGFAVRAAVDIDRETLSAHQLNFPDVTHLSASVAELKGQRLKTWLGLNDDLAGIIGGPPCQGFSAIGHGNEDDERNELFVQFFRVVSESHPRFYLAENVPGIMKPKNSAIRDRAFSLVANEYVMLPPMILSAADFGAPTTRKRVFFFGYLRHEMRPLTIRSFMPPVSSERVFVKDALRGLPKKINPCWQTEGQSWRIVRADNGGYYSSRLHGHVPTRVGNQLALQRLSNESRASGFLGTLHHSDVLARYARIECGRSDRISKSHRLDPNGYCPTLRAGTGPEKGSFQAVRPLHPTENRVITPREAARLQGFPDWFQFSPTKWHSFRQIGSSVSPIVAEQILAVIKGALKG